jgi:hypothetical protein
MFFGMFRPNLHSIAELAAGQPRLQQTARCAKQCAPDLRSGAVTSSGDGNMAGTVEQKLTAQGITLPEPRAAMAN